MKKSIVLVVLLCLITLVASVGSAGPAPNLTNVKIIDIGSDNTGWVVPSSGTTLYGQNFYVAVQFTGYPLQGGVFFYQNGGLIPPSQITEPFARIGTGNGSTGFTGWIYQYKMPLSYGNGTICVKAQSINSGGTYYDTIYGVKSVYQQ